MDDEGDNAMKGYNALCTEQGWHQVPGLYDYCSTAKTNIVINRDSEDRVLTKIRDNLAWAGVFRGIAGANGATTALTALQTTVTEIETEERRAYWRTFGMLMLALAILIVLILGIGIEYHDKDVNVLWVLVVVTIGSLVHVAETGKEFWKKAMSGRAKLHEIEKRRMFISAFQGNDPGVYVDPRGRILCNAECTQCEKMRVIP